MKYSIKITYPSGVITYLGYNGKASWCKSQAYHHKNTYTPPCEGCMVEVEPN